jgi:putative DNA modification/repair radical SAM protein
MFDVTANVIHNTKLLNFFAILNFLVYLYANLANIFCNAKFYSENNLTTCPMTQKTIADKLTILGGAARYDVSCVSSGSSRRNKGKGPGNTVAAGICHSYTEDGRCVSLLKVLLSNYCIYDCAYCINRKSNDRPRTTFTVKELIDLTIHFYRRNYIEGLFLSSGVFVSPNHTMERMLKVVSELRLKENYNGYIHMKAIPGADPALIAKAGLYADRLSVNVEIPTEQNLKWLAPEKNFSMIFKPMNTITSTIIQNREEKKKFKKAPVFVPAGQSTQLVIGATPENDLDILRLSTSLYQKQHLKRVYYSGYTPVNKYDQRLPAITTPPLVRENRLYQADWLMRFYHFSTHEIVNEQHPDLDQEVDPKLSYALRNPEFFPIDINRADYEMILRVPGVGVMSAKKIIVARKYGKLTADHLKKIGVVMKRAQYFITTSELPMHKLSINPNYIKNQLLSASVKRRMADSIQLKLF